MELRNHVKEMKADVTVNEPVDQTKAKTPIVNMTTGEAEIESADDDYGNAERHSKYGHDR